MMLNITNKYFWITQFRKCTEFLKSLDMRQRSTPKLGLVDKGGETTVVLTVWKRNHIEEQLESIANQSLQPSQIWVYQCGSYVDISDIMRRYPEVQHIHSEVNLKYFGRFSLAQYVSTKFVWILDDDVIPSETWLERSGHLCERENAIIASAGRLIPTGGFLPETAVNLSQYFFGDVDGATPFNFNKEDVYVDFGCNSWFFQQTWISDFWQIPPSTLETGEDIHLSASLNIRLGIRTLVPKQDDQNSTGNLKVAYGRDKLASWTKPGFADQRAQIFQNFIVKYGWRPILWGS